jgi:DNA-binding transcriptional LysR family regulator
MVLLKVARAIDALSAAATISNQGRPPALELTIASPSYLAAIVLPALVARLPKARVRMLEFVPAQLRACIVENAFDVAIIPGGLDRLPVAWAGGVAGVCRSGLLARPTLAKRLGPSPLTPDRVRALPFVGPIRTGADRTETMGDQCPMPRAARWIAHEAQTFSAALELASRSDCVVFGPVLAARRLLVAGELVEVPVVGWDVREPLHIMCNGDRVLSRVRDVVVRATRSALDAEPPPVKVAVALTAASR